MKKIFLFNLFTLISYIHTYATKQPNIIIVFADDISARELPIYNSNVWTPPEGGDTKDLKYKAKTPVLSKLAKEGCWITNAWAATICSPSRAMMMTGRYAHRHKWWHNGKKGRYTNKEGKSTTWPLYKSSPLQLGLIAQKSGYATYWAGKAQMTLEEFDKYGFDEAMFTPASGDFKENPKTDFRVYQKKIDGKKVIFNQNTNKPGGLFPISSFYWKPSVELFNHPKSKEKHVLWPNTPEEEKKFGINTYGPDVELNLIFDFIDRSRQKGKPFFIYHTSHLGHAQFDWLHPNDDDHRWPETPKISWDGNSYTRQSPNITGDKGVYKENGTLSPPGIHSQINYLDYQMWLYRKKLEKIGEADNTIIVFCADNGTLRYGKGSSDRQKGTHIPMIIYAPGMKKHGEQNILVSIADILPTVAELVGTKIPEYYEINGKSLVPFLFSKKKIHRKNLYAYHKDNQITRGKHLLKDGRGNWWDVSETPKDLISYRKIENWENESKRFKKERNQLLNSIKPFNLYSTAYNAPGFKEKLKPKRRTNKKKK